MSGAQESIFADGDQAAEAAPITDGVALYRRVAAVAQQRLAQGMTLGREEHRAVREIALIDGQDSAWPDRASMAADLDLSAKQLEKLIAAGCPAPPHSPIPKVPALLWYLAHLRDPGPVQGFAIRPEDDPQQQKALEEVRWRRLKNDALENKMAAEADAMVLTVLSQVMRDLKHRLLFAAPVRIRESLDLPQSAERPIRDQIAATLTAAARAADALEDEDAAEEPTPEAQE